MLGEGDETESVLDCPQFDFAVVASRRDHRSIRRVRHSVQIKEVALLLQDVCLTLPLPNEELPLLFASHCDPVCLRVNRDAIDPIMRYLEGVDGLERVEIVQAEHSIRLADDQDNFVAAAPERYTARYYLALILQLEA